MRVIGLCLFQNEDRFLEACLRNVSEFCDRMILLDNNSNDESSRIAQQLCEEYEHFELHHIKDPGVSHGFIEAYAGTPSWILGVDGDEIYDPNGLKIFKKELISKHYRTWQIYGNVLHCTQVDEKNQIAYGYLARPSRSMTKLYNFSLIDSWKNCREERLHGGNIIFKEESFKKSYYAPCEDLSWEQSPFRCLHAVFVSRSSKDSQSSSARMNIYDKNHTKFWQKMGFKLSGLLGRESRLSAKYSTYRRGQLVRKDTRLFI